MHLTIHRTPFGQLDNTDLWPYALRSVGRQLRDAPTPKGFGVVIWFFPVRGGSTCSLAMPDLADVGISGALHPGFGFFGLQPNSTEHNFMSQLTPRLSYSRRVRTAESPTRCAAAVSSRRLVRRPLQCPLSSSTKSFIRSSWITPPTPWSTQTRNVMASSWARSAVKLTSTCPGLG